MILGRPSQVQARAGAGSIAARDEKDEALVGREPREAQGPRAARVAGDAARAAGKGRELEGAARAQITVLAKGYVLYTGRRLAAVF